MKDPTTSHYYEHQPAILSTLITAFLTAPVLFVFLILHGAAVTSHLAETAVAATHIALLATPALFHVRGVDGPTWRALASLHGPIDEPTGAALGALLGAWLGALPIPLDWDRAWQRWPVTIVAGAYGGWAVGKLAGGTAFKGWNMGGLI